MPAELFTNRELDVLSLLAQRLLLDLVLQPQYLRILLHRVRLLLDRVGM